MASFFLIHLAFSAAARALTPWVLAQTQRLGARRPARFAARLVLAFRLFPAIMALAIVAGLCLPSFVAFENQRGTESAGVPFLAVAALGASAWTLSVARAGRAMVHSHRCLARCSVLQVDQGEPVWVLDAATPLVGLAGVIRPRVLLSSGVARALSQEQMAAALSHERAHRAAADNWKRLLLALTPDALPGVPILRAVDRAWARFSEWAADDWAVAQDARCSVPLAEALVRVARLGISSAVSPMMSRFTSPGDDISSRIERLLNGPAPSAAPSRRIAVCVALGIVVAPFVTAMIEPGSLSAVHELLEGLMH
jgi:Zn-dependent protease with chaperone function